MYMVYVDECVYVCGEFRVCTWCMWMSVCMYVESLECVHGVRG